MDDQDEDDEEDNEVKHTMDKPRMKDLPRVDPTEEAEEDKAPHLRQKNKPGRETVTDEPLDFSTDPLDTINPVEAGLPAEELPGRTFLMPPKEDGTRLRAKIIKQVQEYKDGRNDDPDYIKFKCLVNDDYDEVVAYNDIVDFIEQDDSWDGTWKFEEILDHQGPLKPSDPRYKGAKWNVLLRWSTGEQSWEPITKREEDGTKTGVYDTDPVTVAIYAKEHGLLNTPGWRLPGMKNIVKTEKRLKRHANQAKLHSYRKKAVYMYGYKVPRNHDQAMEFDRNNGNTKWRDAEIKELAQIDEYDTFIDKGKDYDPGKAWKRINVHMVYAVKHDGRHKARLVAGGHLTDTPIDSVYSSVVSLRGSRLLMFIAELNECEIWATDIGNAYLESYTKEKVYIIAGGEFGEREGHTLIISKALYGLKSSGLRWHERFADVLYEMGFFPSKAEPDIWMRPKEDHYEYIGVYVDDLIIISKECKAIIDALEGPYKFKLKGTEPIKFYLGCNYYRDKDGVLCYEPRQYIEKMLQNYERIYGELPKKVQSPLEKGDHPELDTSDLLEEDDIKIYQSLIGALQWVIQIGRWEISTHVMTLSRFRAMPRQGHLDRVKRVHGYLRKWKHGVIKIRTEEPDFSDIPDKLADWEYTCYRGAEEEQPLDAPPILGKPVVMSTYVDANLYHDLVSGKAVTGIMHFLNKTVVDTYSKLQSTVETATFGSEYVASKTAVDQIIDLRLSLRYLGVQVKGPSYLFGDNQKVVETASVPYSKIHKRHVALAYHRTRWAIAAKIVKYFHVRGNTNPADILSKHWDHPSVWDTLKPLMFWHGDTADLVKPFTDEELAKAESS